MINHDLTIEITFRLRVILLWLLIIAGGRAETPVQAANYYVATNGNDSASGTLATPFRTIQKAASLMVGGDTCYIRGGTYRETVTPASSGTSVARITYAGYSNETVIISGLNSVTNSWTLDSGNIYKVSGINPGLASSQGNQVFINGQLAYEARWPNNVGTPGNTNNFTYATVARSEGGNVVSAPTGYATLMLQDSSLPLTNNADLNGATIWCGRNVNYFGNLVAKVNSYSAATHQVFFTDDGANAAPVANTMYIIWGAKALLNATNEWYYDSTNQQLYVWMPDGAMPAPGAVEYKARVFAFDLNNRNYITISNLTTWACGIWGPNSIVATPTSSGIRLLSIRGLYPQSSVLRDGFRLRGNSNEVIGCEFAYAPHSLLNMTGNDCQVINNYLHDGGQYSTATLLATIGKRMIVSHNTLCDAGGSLASPEITSGAFQYNHLYRAAWHIKDIGLTYMNYTDGQGSLMHHNVLHDNLCQLRTDQAHGFYHDWGVSDFIYDRNIFYNIPAGNAFFFAYTWNTLIYNNSLYQAKNHIVLYSLHPATAASATLFANNVAPLSPVAAPGGWDLRNFYSDYPDPAFANTTNQDFRPTSASPYLDKGALVSGVTTNYTGLAPDGGAYELGDALFTVGCNFTNPPAPSLLVLPDVTPFEFRNLVRNGSFEDSDNTGTNWTFSGTAAVNATADISSQGRTFCGDYRVDFSPGTGTVSQTVTNLSPATRYVATAYFQVPNTESATSANFLLSGYGGASLTNSAPVSGSSSWTNVTVNFIMGSAATGVTLTVQCTVAHAGDTNRVDLVCLRKGPPPVFPALPDFVVNPFAPQLQAAIAATYATVGGVVNYQLDSAPAGAVINLTNGVLTWDTTGLTNGTYNFMVRAFDRDYPAAHFNQAAFQVLVTNGWAMPSYTNSVGNPMVINAAVSGTAATNPAVVYSLGAGAPSGVVVNPSTGIITWTPTNSGVYSIPVVATLGGSNQNTTVAVNITDMVAWYPFDTTYGGLIPPGPAAVLSTFTPDASGNGLDAALYGNAELTPGKNGNALHTPSGVGWAQLPGGIFSNISSNFTIACWLRMDSANWFANAYNFSVSRSSGLIYLAPVTYVNDPANAATLRFYYMNAAGTSRYLQANALPVGVWKHVTVTLAGNTLTMYVDGVLVAQDTGWTLRLSDMGLDDNNLIGSSADSTFDGKVDDFRVYTRALSASEIASLAQAAPGRWTGGGTDNKWSTAANWNTGVPPTNSSLWFKGGTRTTSTNDFAAATPFVNLNFGTSAGVFNLSGNSLTLAGDIVSESSATQTVAMPLILAAGSHILYAPTNGRLVLSGALSGAGQLLMQAGGWVTLGGSNTFSGGVEIQSGLLQQGSAAALGSGVVNVRDGATLDLAGYNATVALVESGAFITNSSATPVTLTISNSADTTLWQTSLRGGPIALAKAGAGNLIIHGTPAFAGSVNALGGALILGYQPPVSADLPIVYNPGQRPDVHWDASDVANMVTNASGAVSRWYNSESNATYLAAQDNTNQQPHLVSNALNGLPVVDFGPTGSGATLGDWMQLASPSTTSPYWTAANSYNTIRSAFWVIKGAGNLLGDDASSNFRRGSPDGSATAPIWSASSASPRVFAGVTYLNGQPVDGTVTPLSTNYNLVSLIASGGDIDQQNSLGGSRLANDQNTISRSGGQQIAEVILYSRVLGDDERQQVEAYLAQKWFNLQPAQLWSNNLPNNLNLTIASNAVVSLAGSQQFGNFNGVAGGQLMASNGVLVVGAGNATSTFGGNIAGNTSLVKIGSGIITLAGANTYSGSTSVSNGTLAVTSRLANGVVTVATNGTIAGNGSIAGAVTVQAGGVLSPGIAGMSTLTVSNALTLQAGSTTTMEISKLPLTNDQVRVTGLLTYGGTLAVTNLAGTLTGGETFQLFSAGSRSGNFATVTGSPGNGLTWSFNPTNGVLAVVNPIPTTPANLTWNVSSTNLNLSWPASYIGWVLQSQTNTLMRGLGINWVDMAGSFSTNQWSSPLQSSNPAVFFRLRSP